LPLCWDHALDEELANVEQQMVDDDFCKLLAWNMYDAHNNRRYADELPGEINARKRLICDWTPLDAPIVCRRGACIGRVLQTCKARPVAHLLGHPEIMACEAHLPAFGDCLLNDDCWSPPSDDEENTEKSNKKRG
jgi:hypothetical protein